MNVKRLVWLTITVSLFSLQGCANLTSPARMRAIKKNQAYWFDYDASRRGAILLSRKTDGFNMAMCAEPSPDVALEFANKILVEAQAKGVDAKVQGEFSSDVVELAKRSQTIMFLREAMFRLCEQSLNNKFTSQEVLKLYEMVINTSLKFAEAELADKQADLARQVKDPETRKFMEELFKKGEGQ
jgi:hypothetical protein